MNVEHRYLKRQRRNELYTDRIRTVGPSGHDGAYADTDAHMKEPSPDRHLRRRGKPAE